MDRERKGRKGLLRVYWKSCKGFFPMEHDRQDHPTPWCKCKENAGRLWIYWYREHCYHQEYLCSTFCKRRRGTVSCNWKCISKWPSGIRECRRYVHFQRDSREGRAHESVYLLKSSAYCTGCIWLPVRLHQDQWWNERRWPGKACWDHWI